MVTHPQGSFLQKSGVTMAMESKGIPGYEEISLGYEEIRVLEGSGVQGY